MTSTETADLLEALRRRRGQREPLPGLDVAGGASRASTPVALFDALEPGYEETAEPESAQETTASERAAAAGEGSNRRGKGRTSMPSWDEIVFGARTDD